jgi:hypothetical protein
MALDLREGDYLVAGGKEYPIRSCAAWAWERGRAARRLMTVTASTKRAPALSSGRRGELVAVLTGIKCTPLDPIDPELRQRLDLRTPHELLGTFVDGGDTYYALVLEDLKR